MNCCVLEPDAGPEAESCLDFDMVEPDSTAAKMSVLFVDSCVMEKEPGPSSLRDPKILEGKHKWLQRRRSLGQQQSSEDLNPENGEGNGYSPPQCRQIVSQGQRQTPRSAENTSKRQRIKLPLKTQIGSRPLPDKVVGKGRVALVLQDLESGQEGGDLVQVRIAHIADSECWTGVQRSRSLLENGKSKVAEQFSRSWGGVTGQ
jgi:hypothetical protein